MMQAFRGAVARFTGRLFLGQWAGNFLLMLLAAAWLQIPDSHTWQFAVSVLAAVLLVIAFLWLYTATFRHLRPCAARPPRWQSWLVLGGSVLLWWLLLQPIGAGRAHESLFAGYMNSQAPPELRYRIGYSALVAWQERLYDCVQWWCAGLLVPLAMELCACGVRAGSGAARAYRRWTYWLCVLVSGLGGSAVTWALAGWIPDAGLAGQTLSVIARLGAAYTVDILLWCFMLALIAHYLDVRAQEDERVIASARVRR